MKEQLEIVMERLAKLEAETKAFRASMRKWLDSLQHDTCPEHNIELPVDYEGSMAESWRTKGRVVRYIACPRCAKVFEASAMESRLLRCGIPQKVLHATFENFETKREHAREVALAKFKTQLKIKRGFIIALGHPGTGKSHLAAATLKAGGGGVFITEADLIGELRQTYASNEGQDAMVEKYRKASVLVIDELSTEVKGVDIPNLLYRILAHRYDNNRLTIITSNEELATCLSIFGPKLTDRVRESYVVANFTWESHRSASKL